MSFKIENQEVGFGFKPYVIAELSANHNGSLEKALKAISTAKKCGADAIKLQTYTPESMTIDCDKEDFMIRGGLWDGYKLFDLYKEAHTPYDWFPILFDHAKEINITIFSTPFDEHSVDLLENLNTPAYKVASFELTDLPLIKYIARKGKPMIISTGLSSYLEIHEAIKVAKKEGCRDIALLHCISSYPAPIEEANLNNIKRLSEEFDVEVGLSDHTLGTTASIASVALGASIIEKHFKIDENDEGPDSAFSLTPKELTELCVGVNQCWKSLGSKEFFRQPSEVKNKKYRRSIYVVKDIKCGEFLSKDNIKRIRPGFGLEPKYYEDVLGKKFNCDLPKGTPLKYEYLNSEN